MSYDLKLKYLGEWLEQWVNVRVYNMNIVQDNLEIFFTTGLLFSFQPMQEISFEDFLKTKALLAAG